MKKILAVLLLTSCSLLDRPAYNHTIVDELAALSMMVEDADKLCPNIKEHLALMVFKSRYINKINILSGVDGEHNSGVQLEKLVIDANKFVSEHKTISNFYCHAKLKQIQNAVDTMAKQEQMRR